MMKSRIHSTQHEAQNARNLLRWEQEVFSRADCRHSMTRGVSKDMMNHARVSMVQRNAAGSLRLSLKSPLFFNSPQSGGSKGVDGAA